MHASEDLRAGTSGPRTFACHTAAQPAQVWAALTGTGKSSAYLYGLATHSTWDSGAPIDVRHDDRTELTGRVLCARPNERLSYLLRAGPVDPPVYLTWLIRRTPGGSTIRLQIDEVDCHDSVEEAEDAWLPVLAALQQLLAAT